MENSGVMWFENNSKVDLTKRVQAGAARHVEKFGVQPNVCLVNPKTELPAEAVIDGIRLRKDQYVLPDNYLLILEKVNNAKK